MAEDAFIVVNKKVEATLRRCMLERDVTPAVLTLVRAAVAVHEHAFHYPTIPKETVVEIATDGFDAAVAYGNNIPAVLKQRKEALAMMLESPNARRAFGFSYMHAATTNVLSRDGFAAFIADAWESGAHQRAVNEGSAEVGLNKENGVALGFACHLALQGRRKGLIE